MMFRAGNKGRPANVAAAAALAAALAGAFFAGGSCSKKQSAPSGSGFIEATETVVSSQATGTIKVLRTDEGLSVTAGDTIAEIDTVTPMLRLRQARSARDAAEKRVNVASIAIEQADYNADLAGKTFERTKALLADGSANRQHYDQDETAYKQAVLSRRQAEAAFESARADLAKSESDVMLYERQFSYCFPVAPVSGEVATKYVDPGEWTTSGKSLFRIAWLDSVWVKIYVPAGDLARIKLGGRATVNPEDGSGRIFDGTIIWISDQAEFTPKNVQTKEARADLVYAVKVSIRNPEAVLKIGMPVFVTLE
jgi:HlyD family secretion protein